LKLTNAKLPMLSNRMSPTVKPIETNTKVIFKAHLHISKFRYFTISNHLIALKDKFEDTQKAQCLNQ